ncbi:MAG: SDR family oxidoreductase [Actinobacteria bacterium]|nr:SDR family oxidoreductase [Actinomycetota bacterium]MCL6105486.1 SDR family oxidoreductase [Actinomycetota bacterium]
MLESTVPPGKRVLVTGGAGFIGSHLCDRLLARGDEVICVDNFCTGLKDNISHLIGSERFTLLSRDICEGGLDVSGDLDVVVHLASPASPKDYLEIPIETLEVGSTGTKVCLELAEQTGARIVFASTSEVYGDPWVHPQKETYWGNVNPVGPRSVYDEAKRFSEALCMAWHRRYGTNVGIVRIFNTYGPRLKASDGRVVSNFIVQALQNESLSVYGDGSQTRSLCYVDDLVSGLTALIDSDVTGPVNMGNMDEYTVLQLAERIIELTGSASQITFLDLPQDDPTRRKPDTTLAFELFGWKAEVSLDEGLGKTIDYFVQRLGSAGSIR